MTDTLAMHLVRPYRGSLKLLTDALLIIAGSALVAATAQVAFPLPFSPVPITGQTFGVMVAGAALGSRRGALTMILYLVEGALGLPVFAGGTFGPAVLLGPTAGYLYGFVAAAFAIGWLAERGYDRTWKSAIPAFALGQVIVFLFGLPWLAQFVGRDAALVAGLYPFIPGLVIKTALATLALPSAWALAQRSQD